MMITILKGGFDPPRTRRRARQVREDVAILECSSSTQARKEGYYRLAPDKADELIGPARVWVSPLLAEFGITLDSFPDGFSFGNHGTNSSVPLKIKTGSIEVIPLAWQVFPYGVILTSTQLYRLQEIFEGIPPGNPERHVWVPSYLFDQSL